MKQLKDNLFEICSRYNEARYIHTDPILFPYRFSKREDIELVAFISALFSYGNIKQINLFLESLFLILGKSPKATLINNSFILPQSTYYRFQNYEDIRIFLNILRDIYLQYGSLERIFDTSTEDTQQGIINFQKIASEKVSKYTIKPGRGLIFLIGKGLINSPNKRYHMFLRWMVRKKFPDFGIYESISPKKLLFPLDTHILKISRLIGFYEKSSSSYIVAKKITDEFRNIHPEDPLIFDFPLSRLGILKKCKNTYIKNLCDTCTLRNSCKIYALPR